MLYLVYYINIGVVTIKEKFLKMTEDYNFASCIIDIGNIVDEMIMYIVVHVKKIMYILTLHQTQVL
jgi:hypothetical protein